LKVLKELSCKSPVRRDPQGVCCRVIQLDVPEIGVLQRNRGIENLFEHSGQVCGFGEACAHLVDAPHVLELGRQRVLEKIALGNRLAQFLTFTAQVHELV
jgi:hypothetical protein